MKEQASQTLFRFVSFRAPELIESQQPGHKFIYELIDDEGELRVRKPSDGTYKDRSTNLTLLTSDEARSQNVLMHDFGAWIQKNRRDFDFQKVVAKLQEVSKSTSLDDEEQIWLNLYHQFKTQEDNNARESLINLITAKNFYDESQKIARDTSEEELLKIYEKIAYARIVIPSDVITVVEVSDSDPETPPFGLTPPRLASRMKSNIATYKLEKLGQAKRELEALEKRYLKEYEVAHETAFKTHSDEVKEITNTYKIARKSEEAAWYRERLPSLKTVKEEELLFSKIAKTKVPEVPEFDFTFRPEIDTARAKSTLPTLLFNTLSRLAPIEQIDRFETAYKLIEDTETQYAQKQVNNKELVLERISFDGTIVNASNKRTFNDPKACYTLTLQFETSTVDMDGNWDTEYYIHIESNNKNVDIQQIEYEVSYDGEDETSGTTYEIVSFNGSDEITIKLFTHLDRLELEASRGIPLLSGSITLDNGDELEFKNQVLPNSDRTQEIFCENDDDNILTDYFVPSGHGIRQLGIADYRRVEQSVHCYVESEVSHIENLMAREYKERSTRRLRRSEDTTSSTAETEKEKLTDTSTTDRFEMQNEVSKVIAETTNIEASANVSGKYNSIEFSAGGSFAYNTSKEESINQATTRAQEITARAMDRVVQKIKEERITKIIEEYEENNKHGFDNRESGKHAVGVYRWIDKVYKNQIYNYGKRLMYEFLIPEPSRWHRLALDEIMTSNQGTILEKPIDPRISGLSDAKKITRANYQSWAAKYNAEVNAPQENKIYFAVALSDNGASGNYIIEHNYSGARHWTVKIPEGYEIIQYDGRFGYNNVDNDDFDNSDIAVKVERSSWGFSQGTQFATRNISKSLSTRPIRNELGVSFHGSNIGGIAVNLDFKALLTDEAFDLWRNEAFNTIIAAYEEKLDLYNKQFKQEADAATELYKTNPLFFRQTEQTVLRKNCISYLIDRSERSYRTYGKTGLYQGSTLKNTEIKLNHRLDNYTSFATFLEQAMEWDIMSYNFFPFYWADRSRWGEYYGFENDDPIFRKFMQAGMARVVVTVRPGFESAMMHYMATGNIWDGGELPVLNDPLYLSIVDELKQPLGVKEGKAWKTQVPTSLTILQADSLGLKVEKALPCNCEDESDFQESDQTGCSSVITNDPSVFSRIPEKKLVQFSLRHFYGKSIISEVDEGGGFPRTFICQGKTIEISRDASWGSKDSVGLIYQELATGLSTIPSVTATQFDYINRENVSNGSAILFTIDFSVIDVFEFEKEAYGAPNELDKLTVTCDEKSAHFTHGEVDFDHYLIDDKRLADSSGTLLSYEDIQSPLPLSRFIPQMT